MHSRASAILVKEEVSSIAFWKLPGTGSCQTQADPGHGSYQVLCRRDLNLFIFIPWKWGKLGRRTRTVAHSVTSWDWQVWCLCPLNCMDPKHAILWFQPTFALEAKLRTQIWIQEWDLLLLLPTPCPSSSRSPDIQRVLFCYLHPARPSGEPCPALSPTVPSTYPLTAFYWLSGPPYTEVSIRMPVLISFSFARAHRPFFSRICRITVGEFYSMTLGHFRKSKVKTQCPWEVTVPWAIHKAKSWMRGTTV